MDDVNLAAREKPGESQGGRIRGDRKLGLKYQVRSPTGLFDITVGPTVLWHIGFDDAKETNARRNWCRVTTREPGKDVELNDAEQTVSLKKKGMCNWTWGIKLKDISLIRFGEYFYKEGITTAVIDLGGNIVVMGGSPARDMLLFGMIQDPDASWKTLVPFLEKIEPSWLSGIYERYLTVDGQNVSPYFKSENKVSIWQ